MSRLPRISERECIDTPGKVGFHIKRQESSHVVLRRYNPFEQVVVADHKELDRGTLRAIIRMAGLSVEEFVRLLERSLPRPVRLAISRLLIAPPAPFLRNATTTAIGAASIDHRGPT